MKTDCRDGEVPTELPRDEPIKSRQEPHPEVGSCRRRAPWSDALCWQQAVLTRFLFTDQPTVFPSWAVPRSSRFHVLLWTDEIRSPLSIPDSRTRQGSIDLRSD